MEMMKREFIFGAEKIPQWFREEVSRGRAKIVYGDGETTPENQPIKIMVYAPTKTYTAEKGDKIILLKSGLVVLKQEAAKKYSGNPQKQEKR